MCLAAIATSCGPPPTPLAAARNATDAAIARARAAIDEAKRALSECESETAEHKRTGRIPDEATRAKLVRVKEAVALAQSSVDAAIAAGDELDRVCDAK